MSGRTERVVSVHPSVHPSCPVKTCKASLRSSQAFPALLGLLKASSWEKAEEEAEDEVEQLEEKEDHEQEEGEEEQREVSKR